MSLRGLPFRPKQSQYCLAHTRDTPINQYEIANHKSEIPCLALEFTLDVSSLAFLSGAPSIRPATCGRDHISHHFDFFSPQIVPSFFYPFLCCTYLASAKNIKKMRIPTDRVSAAPNVFGFRCKRWLYEIDYARIFSYSSYRKDFSD